VLPFAFIAQVACAPATNPTPATSNVVEAPVAESIATTERAPVPQMVFVETAETPAPPPLEVVVELPKKPSKPLSGLLRSGLSSPMPGGIFAGYVGDTGLDIAGNARPVHAIAAGKVDYSEWGHTRWIGKHDTAFCVRIELDVPIPFKKDSKGGMHKITHLYYAHLASLERIQKEGAKPRAHVEAGEQLGISGTANGMPHLHLGLLLDSDVEQDSWSTILREGEVREVLGHYKNGEALPK